MELGRDEFISLMLKIHQADSSRDWRLLIKNAKMEKSDLSLTTYVQYVEDFRFWVNVAGRPHRIPDKEIAKCFVNGLKPELFREETYARSFENLDDVVRDAREELHTYRDIMEISDRVKRPEPKEEFTKEKKDYSQSASSFKKKGEANSSTGASFSGFKKPASFSVEKDMKDVECFKCHKKGHYANKCPEIKAKDAKGAFKVRKLDDSSVKEEGEAKSIRQIRIRHLYQILMRSEKIHLCDIGLFYLTWDI